MITYLSVFFLYLIYVVVSTEFISEIRKHGLTPFMVTMVPLAVIQLWIPVLVPNRLGVTGFEWLTYYSLQFISGLILGNIWQQLMGRGEITSN